MIVYDEQISEEQIEAALAVMVGKFPMADVVEAFVFAGVSEGNVSGRAADRLLQKERRAGRIVYGKDGLWERTSL